MALAPALEGCGFDATSLLPVAAARVPEANPVLGAPRADDRALGANVHSLGGRAAGEALARAPEWPLAITASRQRLVAPLPPGDYRYRRWRGTTLVTAGGPEGPFTRLEVRTSERARQDGSGRWRAICEASVFVGPRDRALWRAAGSPENAVCAEG
jgi:hypothetical protein